MDLFERADDGRDRSSSEASSSSSSASSSPSSSSSSASQSTSSSGSGRNGNLDQLTVNKEYANRYQHNKQRTELQQLEEKYGSAAAGILAGRRAADQDGEGEDGSEYSDSESDESEDEEGEQVTADVDAAILRTMAKIRSGDASIYDASKQVFDEEKALAAASAMMPKSSRAKVEKKVSLAQYQRNRLRDLMETSSDPALALAEATTSTTREDEKYGGHGSGANNTQPLSHVQEQAQLKRQVTDAFHNMEDEEDEADDFFTKRGALGQGDVEEEADADPQAYRKYLLQNLKGTGSEAAVREALRGDGTARTSSGANALQRKQQRKAKTQAKAAQQSQNNEDFLMNYILNRGWMDNPNAAPKFSSRRQDTTDSEDEDTVEGSRGALVANGDIGRDWEAEAAELESDDEAYESKADAFEQAFNFRYEAMESGQASTQIQSYSRTPHNSVRRPEDKRKVERAERKARKEAEKKAKMSELDRMKSLQKSALREKIRQLKEVAGAGAGDFDELDLEGDFDPDQHDKVMRAFGDDYYAADDDDMIKPSWDDDIDIDDILAEGDEEEVEGKSGKKSKKDKKRKKQQQAANGDDDLHMDADAAEGENTVDATEDPFAGLSKKERNKLLKKQAKKGLAAPVPSAPSTSTSTAPESLPQTASARSAALKSLADEYRSLSYEDVIGGDVATRFHYTSVPKADYGLTPVEILLADDADLNSLVGLKHFQPFRRGGDRKPKDLNRKLREFRRKLDSNESGPGGPSGANAEPVGTASAAAAGMKKRKGKKERMREKAAAAAAGGTVEEGEGEGEGERENTHKKRKLET